MLIVQSIFAVYPKEYRYYLVISSKTKVTEKLVMEFPYASFMTIMFNAVVMSI